MLSLMNQSYQKLLYTSFEMQLTIINFVASKHKKQMHKPVKVKKAGNVLIKNVKCNPINI